MILLDYKTAHERRLALSVIPTWLPARLFVRAATALPTWMSERDLVLEQGHVEGRSLPLK